MGSFLQKTFFSRSPSPLKLHKRPPARLSLAQIPGANIISSENSEGTERSESTEHSEETERTETR